jgi:folate-binding protein YgfZ
MQSPLLTDLHRAAGARLAPGEAPVLLTYGDVPGEYRAAREACAVFDATDRGRVAVAGADASAFLHRILANDVRGLEPGGGNANLLLSPKGKVLHAFDLALEPECIALSTPPGGAAGLIAALDVYLFAEDVQLADETEKSAPLELCGPEARGVLAAVAPELPAREVAVAGSAGLRIDPGPERAAEVWRALVEAGARPAGVVVRDILRVEAGAALFGVDIDDSIYPQEARLESGFSLDKGCYVGQEVVAKIDTYGGLNKRMMALRVSHDDPVPAGTRLFLEEEGEWRDLGVVTSWAYSFELDTGLVLAYVKRKHQEPGTTFRLGDGPAQAAIVALPVRADALG